MADHEKIIFAELCSITKLTFGSEIIFPCERNLRTLRTATINTLWKMHRLAREPNMIFILILKPQKFEPHMALVWTAIRIVRKMMILSAELTFQIFAKLE